MFKDSPEGQTHYENDGCGIKEHNPMKTLTEILKEDFLSYHGSQGCACEVDKKKLEKSLTHLLTELEQRVEGEKKESWKYAGGGGIDTDHWCKKGVCLTIPGIKQIVSYGIKNDKWWASYLFKWNVIIPEKYTNDGYNSALQKVISIISEMKSN